MIKLNPLIILRADMVTPKRVPAAFSSTLDRLVNHILPKLGIQIGIEFFEGGWVIFFGSVSEFRTFFGRPMFSNSRKLTTPNMSGEQEPLIWDYKIERLPSHPPAETFVQILKRFYQVPGSLGEGVFEEIFASGTGTRYRISYPSLAEYLNSAEELVRQAHNMYLSLRNNPNLVSKQQAL